jgi:hypothetical protein
VTVNNDRSARGGLEAQRRAKRIARGHAVIVIDDTAARPRWCPVGYGCRRFTSAVCGECARKFVGGQAMSLVTGLQSVVCKSIAKASKVRILHLPPRAREDL